MVDSLPKQIPGIPSVLAQKALMLVHVFIPTKHEPHLIPPVRLDRFLISYSTHQ